MRPLIHLRALLAAVAGGVLAFSFAGIVALVGSLLVLPDIAHNVRAVDGSNLRQIVQSSLIYAADNLDTLPLASSIHDYARLLAMKGGINEPNWWIDRKTREQFDPVPTAIVPDRKTGDIDPAFQKLPLAYACASGLNTGMPDTTPIAWTRGLQPTGRWSDESPYRGDGGYIGFLGGEVRFYSDLGKDGGLLHRFDGQGMTADIRDALPPETTILNNDLAATKYSWWVRHDMRTKLQNAVSLAWLGWAIFVGALVATYCYRNSIRPVPFWTRVKTLLLLTPCTVLFIASLVIR